MAPGGKHPQQQDDRQHRAGADADPDRPVGVVPQVLDRIFNPFFTTKDTGTGLGLAIVHRVVESHDGLIVAGNEAGGGARFEIRV